VAEITLSELRRRVGYKEQAMVEGIGNHQRAKLAIRTPKTIIKYY